MDTLPEAFVDLLATGQVPLDPTDEVANRDVDDPSSDSRITASTPGDAS